MSIIKYKRYYPFGFLEPRKRYGSDNSSVSEKFARAIISIALDIDYESIARGNELTNEPDYIIKNENRGFEITFACRNDDDNVFKRIKIGNYYIGDSEQDTIQAIQDSLEKKSIKKSKGNYDNVKKVDAFIICLDPIFTWYGLKMAIICKMVVSICIYILNTLLK